jgi:hypothetical protein
MKARIKKQKKERGFYAVDLDGTLAKYNGFKSPTEIGKPVPKMLDRVKKFLRDGHKVKIFTARANEKETIPAIKKWLRKYGLPALPVTNIKGHDMIEFWDDRAKQVIPNTGKLVGGKE